MELTLIEMVAYQSAHVTNELPWRCMACEKLTPHADEDIIAHLGGAHNYPAELLTKEGDSIFMSIGYTTQPNPKEIN